MFTEREFRDALGLFPTGVAIVTADVDGALIGATISSFNSVSLSPPLVLFSLAKKALSIELWQAASNFAITILREDERSLSNRFAKGGADKWLGLAPGRSDEGTPILAAGLATFLCRTHAVHDGGDHQIFVGEVRSFTTRSGDPLLFYGGKYSRLEAPMDTPQGTDHLLHGW